MTPTQLAEKAARQIEAMHHGAGSTLHWSKYVQFITEALAHQKEQDAKIALRIAERCNDQSLRATDEGRERVAINRALEREIAVEIATAIRGSGQ